MKSFQYRPLDCTVPSIRALEIRPSYRSSSRIKCRLHHINVEKSEQWPGFSFYEALSYVWGSQMDQEIIELEGHKFHVTRNLASAIRRLRAKRTSTMLWVDAICINQDDLEERNQQVRLMGKIYRNAAQTLVWLGPAVDDSDLAIDFGMKILDADDPETWAAGTIPNGEYAREWIAVVHLFLRPWWKRVWVVQEAAVASSVAVLCGDKEVLWENMVLLCGVLTSDPVDFRSLAAELLGSQDTPIVPLPSANLCYALGVMRDEIQRGELRSIATLALYCRALEATDPRDRVYATLGIARDGNELMPDYNLSTVEVFRQLVQAVVRSEQCLDILSACQNEADDLGLPSWVPDITEDWNPLPLRAKLESEEYYNACKGTSVDVTFTHDNRGHIMSLSATICDELSVIGPQYFDVPTRGSVVESWRAIASNALKPRLHMLDREALHGIYLRTLLADQAHLGGRLNNRNGEDLTIDSWSEHIIPADEGSDISLPKLNLEHTQTDFALRMEEVCVERSLFATRDGRIGLCDTRARAGDLVAVLFGGKVPFLIRRLEDDHSSYRLIGEAYVHELMDGETMELLEAGILERTVLNIR